MLLTEESCELLNFPLWRKPVPYPAQVRQCAQIPGSAIAEEAIKRIANLYGIETEVWGQLPDVRVQVR